MLFSYDELRLNNRSGSLIGDVQEGGPGGLFDIGATLPLVAIQFLILMFLLNTFLYSPLTTHVNDRNAYILENLSRAGDLLLQANQLTTD